MVHPQKPFGRRFLRLDQNVNERGILLGKTAWGIVSAHSSNYAKDLKDNTQFKKLLNIILEKKVSDFTKFY